MINIRQEKYPGKNTQGKIPRDKYPGKNTPGKII
jgi:hypothetical protein